MTKQLILDIHNKLIVDLFAGGGGMSVAFENAFGRTPDIAINHNDDALSLHRVNHPLTRHFIADVFEVCPKGATQGRPVGWLHLSPDCTHHSQASGGQPRSKKIRGLSWVGYRWAGQVQPDVISLENVKQILKWGPLIAKRCKDTGRVMKLDGTIAEPGERVPVQQQYLVPDPKREGQTWRKFVTALRKLGYQVEHKNLVAADFGGHTTRERLVMIARRDGQPIVWPEPTHFKKPVGKQKKWKPAADCIDFSDLGKSIFDRPKPLAPATLRRIAKGIDRYVLKSPNPFIVNMAHGGKLEPVSEPMSTIATEKGGCRAMATPTIVRCDQTSACRRNGVHTVDEPINTITTSGGLALSSPVLVPVTHQGADRVNSIEEPIRTITAAHRGETMLASPVMVQAAHGDGQPGGTQRWGSGVKDPQEPLGTITGSGGHAVASAVLVGAGGPEYSGKPTPIDEPIGTLLTENHRAVATAILAGVGGRAGQSEPKPADEPMNTTTAKADTAVVTAYMMQANDGFNTTVGRELDEPMTTITNSGSQQQLVSAFVSRQFGTSVGHGADEPHGTFTADGGGKSALVECLLSPEQEAGALRVAAFLMEYYSEGGQWSELDKPLNTITTKDRLALVTVMIQGTPYVIVDIRLRMLKPRELFNGQDFPSSYIIDRGHDGRRFSISKQVRMCGNSVDPIKATAFLSVNAPWLAVKKAA
jgi:DNA (cytosine-5)-methyltransferase 1